MSLVHLFWNNEKCLNDKMACEVLNSTMKELIGESLDVSSEVLNKAYELNIYYRDLERELADDLILEFSEGDYANCSSEIGGSHSIAISGLSPGLINVELDVCRGGEV